MGIETAAQRLEKEAVQNPESAAASIALLNEVQQGRILAQMHKDAETNGASFNYERNPKTGEITAIQFQPMGIIHQINTKSPDKDSEKNASEKPAEIVKIHGDVIVKQNPKECPDKGPVNKLEGKILEVEKNSTSAGTAERKTGKDTGDVIVKQNPNGCPDKVPVNKREELEIEKSSTSAGTGEKKNDNPSETAVPKK